MKQVTEKLWLENDDYGYILKEKIIYKQGKHIGKEYFVPYGYFPNLKQVVRRLVDDGLTVWVNQDMEALNKYFEDTYNKFLKVIENDCERTLGTGK